MRKTPRNPWKPKMNSSCRLCKQDKFSPTEGPSLCALFVHANGGHRFPGCGQDGEPPGDEGGVKFVTEQIWPLVSGIHLNANLISNVKYTPSPFLAFLNKWLLVLCRTRRAGCACRCVFV